MDTSYEQFKDFSSSQLSFSEKKNINFTTNNGFLNLISSNGIKHKSKQIKAEDEQV